MRVKVVEPRFRLWNLFTLGLIGIILCLFVGFGYRDRSAGNNISNNDDDGQEIKAISVFVLMGKTGSGKSSFINSLNGTDAFGRKPVVSDGIDSSTQSPTVYLAWIGKRKILLLDTPGFDDSARDNLEVLNDIVSSLYSFALRPEDFEMRGVIFLHDISEIRFGGSQKKTLGILRAIVGEENLGNVIVGTTMWSSTWDAGKLKQQEKRERALLDDQWGGIRKTTRLSRDSKNVAAQIIYDLLAGPPALLLVQTEMLQPPHTIEATTVGKLAMPEGRQELEDLQRKVREREKEFEAESKRQEALLQEQVRDTKRRFEAQEMRSRQKEESQRLKQQEDMKKFEGKLRKEFKRESKSIEDKIRKDTKKREQEEKEIRKLEEDLRVKLIKRNKIRVEKARKDAEEQEKIKAAIKRLEKPPVLTWFANLISIILTWFR